MEAPASITCPDCRTRWQRLHNDQGKAIIHTPIGYLVVYLEVGGKEIYYATARSYADLRSTVARLDPGTQFTIHLCIFLDIVGGGSYTRTFDGVEVRHESRAAEGLHLAMCEAKEREEC